MFPNIILLYNKFYEFNCLPLILYLMSQLLFLFSLVFADISCDIGNPKCSGTTEVQKRLWDAYDI